MKLVVLTPGRGSVSKEHRDMLLLLSKRLTAHGHTMAVCDETTSGMLAHSRSVLLGTLSQQRCDWGLWADTDCSWDPDAVLEMMKRPEDMIVWNYPIRVPYDLQYPPERLQRLAAIVRSQHRRWTGTAKMSPGAGRSWSPDGRLIELSQCAFGSVLMRQNIAAFMANRLPPTLPDWDGRMIIPAFEVMQNRVGEDYSFCRRYVRAGGRIWCDPRPYVTNGGTGGCF